MPIDLVGGEILKRLRCAVGVVQDQDVHVSEAGDRRGHDLRRRPGGKKVRFEMLDARPMLTKLVQDRVDPVGVPTP